MCNDCQECHDSSPHLQRVLWVWRVRRGASQEVSETHTDAPTLPCLFTLCKTCTQASKSCFQNIPQPRIMSSMPKQQAPCYHFIITPPSLELASPSTATLYPHPCNFSRDVHLSVPTNYVPLCSHTHTVTQFDNTYTQHSHWGCTPTNVTFNGHSLSHKHMHTYSTLLHREPCCVLSGRTQMAATWGVLMGSCDGFGQDMDTHTDGDPLRVAWRWTCWLLICSDQWFTTWSPDTGGVAPTELAHWLGTLGTHHCIYTGNKST